MDKNISIIILGAGYSGIRTAQKLNMKYRNNTNIEIILIDRQPFHTLMTELHEVAGGRVSEDSVKIPLNRIFHRSSVKVVNACVENIDMEKNTVKTNNENYTYDYLVISTGAEPAFFDIPGVEENGFTLWSLKDAIKIRNHIIDMFKRASMETDSTARRRMLNFIVAGSGFTGVEMAGELSEWKTSLSKKYSVDENEVNLMLVEAQPDILNLFDKDQSAKAESYMIKHDIKILKNSPITKVGRDSIELKNGSIIQTNTLIWTCGIHASEQVSRYGLETGKSGRIKTNSKMQVLGKDNIYAGGDTSYYEYDNGKAIPQIVETALQSGETIAKNIISQIENTKSIEFRPKYHGFMVSLGGKYCVASLSGIKLSGFFAVLIKHLVNLHYLFGLNGINACYHYLIHEFFSIKDSRCLMRGHLSSKANRLWLLPLRIFIGCLWVLEGLHKFIGESTWNSQGFSSLKNGIAQDSWMKSGNMNLPFEWLHTAANSGATEAVKNSSSTSASQTQPIFNHIPDFYNWIMNIFIPNQTAALWFQRTVVIAEILIGLALIAGFLTFLASAASVFLVINFVLSAMAGWETLWYIFGAIALMGGAGRTFGMDYFIIPWIRDKISNWRFGKNIPMYRQ
ncbi:MAG: FAD-dependent oxidoreductase [Clostridium sp.]|jgi:NADH dehydrogenase|uniref:FAD-dependent oxidoreductase n=1 Tax=Clostridium sp. TaxID=1506 RepID=UPI0025C242E4|nr:FAD-dependent oxidoreductase [Clostridium sp.]MCH3963762.1 FAD-dependent oxidoreductase [Clostridium sp.]MCI1714903.1 FAD-dependent oxidoreductase [Clostridium sp.]MCI1798908.1 FAD-dependent oxidoreductase [Clostridium sp.]MCI1813086.1 FAD-dependent oxidoreductase [Clostridium sp.]MCI1869976.1 FAD-dependent oxidoreductase [Clostridium sp.]